MHDWGPKFVLNWEVSFGLIFQLNVYSSLVTALVSTIRSFRRSVDPRQGWLLIEIPQVCAGTPSWHRYWRER